MSQTYDAAVIGGGHNGLIAATLMAQAGLKAVVLERADRIGGCAVTDEVAPGYRCSTLAHRAALDRNLIRALNLTDHGLEILKSDALVCAPTPDGNVLTLWSDPARTAGEIARFSASDARQYPGFLASVAAVSGAVRSVMAAAPPPLDDFTARDLLQLLKTARRFRTLQPADAYRLLRWLPMPVVDLVHEWFESEPLCAAIASGGLLGSFVGPRSAGSAAVLLLLAAGDGHPIAPGWMVRGGMGVLGDAIGSAARRAGVDIRIGSEVREILIQDGSATGVALATGERVTARRVVSSADPHRTFLGLIDPLHLNPEFLRAVRNIRLRGTLAKINYAVSSLPGFRGLASLNRHEQAAALSGCVRLGPTTEALERAFDAAKYGRVSDEPWIELTIPSIVDRTAAPDGGHVVSAYAQYAPYQLRDTTWDAQREPLGDLVTRTIENYAPGFTETIVARQIITPLDLERIYGLTGGHAFHGELALDQLVVARPLLGWARYRTPIRNLFLCGSGTHPGTGLDGRSGALAAREVIASLKSEV